MSWKDGYEADPSREPHPRDGYEADPNRQGRHATRGDTARIERPRPRIVGDAHAPSPRAPAPPRALLDRSPTPVSAPSPMAGAISDSVPWYLPARLWPALLAARHDHALTLASLTLTAPEETDVRAPAADLAASIAGAEGVLLVVERAAGDAEEHLHGLALVAGIDKLRGRWRELTGAAPQAVKAVTVTGWVDHLSGESTTLFAEVAKVLRYAFKPLPYGTRDLELDVWAGGAFTGPWAAARRDVASARACPGCGGSLDGKRRDAKWCSARCKSAASRRRPKATLTTTPF